MGVAQMAADTRQAADAGSRKAANEAKFKEQLEKIKERVIEMFGDAARNQVTRNGVARRP